MELVEKNGASEQVYELIRPAIERSAKPGTLEYAAIRRQLWHSRFDNVVDCTKCQSSFKLKIKGVFPRGGIALRCSVCRHLFLCDQVSLGTPATAQTVWLLETDQGKKRESLAPRALIERVVNRRAHKSDRFSISGGAWLTLGDIPEFSFFFGADNSSRTIINAIIESPPTENGIPHPASRNRHFMLPGEVGIAESLSPIVHKRVIEPPGMTTGLERTPVSIPPSILSSTERSRQQLGSREEAEQRWGTVVAGRYRLEDLLVFDGSGALYRARDTERGVPCTLRLLPEIYARDQKKSSQFELDAKAAQRLIHLNIAQVFDIGRLDDGTAYTVTELLDGQSLATIVRKQGKLSLGRAVHVASQVCRALGSAHEAGIIHRDFKPANVVLVSQEGDLDFVKVVDFGIISHIDSEPTMTASQLVVGSPDYMAPEQAAGVVANPASNIYALGVVLYEMLTGQRPYKGRNAIDILIQKGAHDAPRVTGIQPDVPEALADIVAWCLARMPEDRPTSMQQLELVVLRALTVQSPPRSAVAAAPAKARADDP